MWRPSSWPPRSCCTVTALWLWPNSCRLGARLRCHLHHPRHRCPWCEQLGRKCRPPPTPRPPRRHDESQRQCQPQPLCWGRSRIAHPVPTSPLPHGRLLLVPGATPHGRQQLGRQCARTSHGHQHHWQSSRTAHRAVCVVYVSLMRTTAAAACSLNLWVLVPSSTAHWPRCTHCQSSTVMFVSRPSW
jgi:hypothetical protein